MFAFACFRILKLSVPLPHHFMLIIEQLPDIFSPDTPLFPSSRKLTVPKSFLTNMIELEGV